MPGTMQPINVTKTPLRMQSFMVENTSFLLVNPDIVNQIFIGNDVGSQFIPIPPLGSVTLGGTKQDIWVSTNGGNYSVQAFALPEGTNWTPSPAQVAAQIQALGLATSANQGTQINHESNIDVATGNANLFLGGNVAGALTSTPNKSISQDMLHANAGVTSEIAALLASGNPAGAMGGIPLLRFTNKLGNANNQNIAALSSVPLIAFVPTNQPSYECTFVASLPAAAGTIPFVQLTLQWNDASTGMVNDTEEFIITSGNGPANAITTYLSGPVRGDELSVIAFNLDPAQALTLTWVINGTSHVFERDRLVQPNYAPTAPVGQTNPAGSPQAGLIAAISPIVAALATSTRLLASYNGRIGLNINARGQANNITYTLQDPGTLYSTLSGGTFWSTDTPTGGGQAYFENINLPDGPVLYTIINRGSSGTVQPTVSIIKAEY